MSFSPVAIVGRGCVLPGAFTPEALWDHVAQGRDLISSVPEGSWPAPAESYISAKGKPPNDNQSWSIRGGFIRGFEQVFDASSLGIPVDDALRLDRSVQWLLHAGREAVRDAGRENFNGVAGAVVVGNLSYPTRGMGDYAQTLVLEPALKRAGGRPPAISSSALNRFSSGLPASLLARSLGLKGAAFCLDAACASSLYAIKLACDYLQSGDADVAIAGGFNGTDTIFLNIGFSALKALSRTGMSRPFHRNADGLLPAEGAAAICLKRLEDAERAGDRIHGVIRGVGLSNDGFRGGLLNPDASGQVRAIRQAYSRAGIDPKTVSMLECHATGTPAGDLTEMASVSTVFEGVSDLPVGSLKSNVGHLITVAGLAGVLKVTSAMAAGVRPPTLHLDDPIDALTHGPFRPLLAAEPWSVVGPRRAGLNNFGFGGNNAHLIIEQYEPPATPRAAAASRPRKQERIAVCGVGVIVGNDRGLNGFAHRYFEGAAAQEAIPTKEVRLPLVGLRFPPNDLAQSFGQQTLVFEAVLQSLRGVATAPAERSGIFIGMGCDVDVSRLGLRWRLGPLMQQSGLVVDEEETARFIASVTGRPTLQFVLGAMPNLPANRLNVQNNWQGMGFTVSGEELSGIVALERAVRALASRELDFAVAGAVDLSCEAVHCRALSEAAPESPATPADAAVSFVLKRLDDAEAAGDTIYATLLTPGEDAIAAEDDIESESVSGIFGHSHAASGLLDFLGYIVDRGAGVQSKHSARATKRWTARSFTGQRESLLVADVSVGPGCGAMPDAPHILTAAGENFTELRDRLGENAVATKGTMRLAIAAADAPQLARRRDMALAALRRGDIPRGPGIFFGEGPPAGDLAFVYPGIGSWYQSMERPLLRAFPETVEKLIRGVVGMPSSFFPMLEGRTDAEARIKSCVLYASLTTDIARGILGVRPAAGIGLSMGETSMLVALGAWRSPFQILDGLRPSGYFEALGAPWRAVATSWKLADGENVDWEDWQIFAPVEQVRRALDGVERTGIAIVISDDECAIAGAGAACRLVIDRLGASRAVKIGSRFAAHRPDIMPFAEDYRRIHSWPADAVEGIRFYFSAGAASGALDGALVGELLTKQMTGPIDFRQSVRRAHDDGVRAFVEIGPRTHLAHAIAKTLPGSDILTVGLDAKGRPLLGMAEAVAALFARGLDVDIAGFAKRLSHLRGIVPAESDASVRHLVLPITREPTEFALRINADEGRALHAISVEADGSEIMPLPPRRLGWGALPARQWPSDRPSRYEILGNRVLAPETNLAADADQAAPAASIAARPTLKSAPPVAVALKTGLATAPSTPARPFEELPPSGKQLNRAELETVASGRISDVFGALFVRQDGFVRQCRMPMPPLLLVDRVTGIAGEPGSMGRGTIWTETDVKADAGYMHRGRMPAGIFIEAGQADLLLISWLGCDFLNKDERVYRLLGCEITFHSNELPRAGETVRYQIHIDGHAETGGTRLFFFRYDSRVGDRLVSSVRNGQAGFFTDRELAGTAGVLWDAAEDSPKADARLDAFPRLSEKRSFTNADVLAFAGGDAFACFGKGFERAAAHQRTPAVPVGQMRLFDRIVAFDPTGGPWGRGYLRAEADVPTDAWFYSGHFLNDPCMPGTLMAEAAAQVLSFFMAAVGLTIERDGWIFAPATDEPFKFICRGQVIPNRAHLVTYEVFVEEVVIDDKPRLHAALLAKSDGLKVFLCRRFGVQLIPDWPLDEREGLSEPARIVSPGGDVPGHFRSLLAAASGRPSEAFGSMYAPFDGARPIPRLPGVPYHFVSRIVSVDCPRRVATIEGKVVAQYDVPPDAWYFAQSGNGAMPFCVLFEAIMQPCGWLATYMGYTLGGGVVFRNLDGQKVRVEREVAPDEGVLTIEARHTRSAKTGPMAIVNYDVVCRSRRGVIATISLVFGFFPPAALASQAGLPTTAQQRGQFAAISERGVSLGEQSELRAPGRAALPSGRLALVDEVTGWWPAAGAAGLGRIRGLGRVNPRAWYFKAHFFQDPVQPGSLGLEALIQLAKAAALLSGLDKRFKAPRFETPAAGSELAWKYRGQVTPESGAVTTEIEIVSIDLADNHTTMTVAGNLWVDGLRIYEFTGFKLRLSENAHSDRPLPKTTTQTGEGVLKEYARRLDSVASPWLLDHRPNYLKAAFPMAGVAETLLDLPTDQTGRPASVERLELSRWIVVDEEPVDLLLREKSQAPEGRTSFDLLTRRADNGATVLTGRATLARAAHLPQAPAAWPLPTGAAVGNPYEEGGMFHDGLFRLARNLRESDKDSVFEIALEQVWAHPEAARVTLFDAFLHGIPHARPWIWFGDAIRDCSVLPYRLENLTIYADIPRKGVVNVVTRAIDMPTPRTIRAAAQMQIDGRVLMSMVITEAVLGTPDRIAFRERRAYYRDRRAAPGARLSRSTPEGTIFGLRALRAVEWMPGTVEHLYDVSGNAREKVEAVAIKEHLATPLGLHPSAVRIEAGQAFIEGRAPVSLDRFSRRWLDGETHLVSDIPQQV